LKIKKIFIVRHGETDYNKKKKVQGSGINASLNRTGIDQAERFFDAYKKIPFDKVYVSNLVRTAQSVDKFIENGIPMEKLEGLNEISWGNQEGRSFDETSHENYLAVTQAWKNGEYHRNVGGGETPLQVMERQKKAIDHILSQNTEDTILICMHGRAMRILLCWLLNYPLRFMDQFTHENLCLYKLSYTGSMFTIESFDERTHLN